MLSLKNVTVKVAEKTIIKNLTFDFEGGKIYAIMGPNGSGKSTLAYSVMGHPTYKLNGSSKILLNKKNITKLSAQKRAQMGIFLSFQSPLSLSGVRINQLLQFAKIGKKNAIQIYQEVKKFAQDLKIAPELLSRSLNDGASGGEKKKFEVLQAAVLDKQVMIFDEIDTGVDVDALKTISNFLLKIKNKEKIYILITHYTRILHYLKPDKVLILKDGQLKKVGDYRLASEIEKHGYKIVD